MNIKVGDVVLVEAHPSGDNHKYDITPGFNNSWVSTMDKLIGTQQIVKNITNEGVCLSGGLEDYRYPPSGLKVIKGYVINIQELQAERDALEERLRSYIREELASFQLVTGVGISSAYIDIVSYRNLGDVNTTYIVNKVEVKLDI